MANPKKVSKPKKSDVREVYVSVRKHNGDSVNHASANPEEMKKFIDKHTA